MTMTHEDREHDRKIDAWRHGWTLGYRGHADLRPTCQDTAEGWDAGREARKVHFVTPARPEGYYHAPTGTFD